MLEGIFFFLIALLTLSFAPFEISMDIPTAVRIFIILLILILALAISWKKKQIFYFLLGCIPVAGLYAFVWWRSSPQSLPTILYTLAFMMFAVLLLHVCKRYPKLAFLLSRLFFGIIMGTSIMAIVSFFVFNLDLVSYRTVQIGDFDYYNFYYHPLFGYIAPKKFGDNIEIGRVAGYMFEPSYMGWFLTSNFFIIDKYFRKRSAAMVLSKIIVFLGALTTFSTGGFIVFIFVFLVMIAYKVLEKFSLSKKTVNIIIGSVIAIGLLGILAMPKEQINDSLGSSSYGDRDDRMQTSLFILGTSGVVDLLLGHSPAFIENSDVGKGESNQYLKLIVEEGIILTIVVIYWLIYCTRKSKYFMLANLLFLSSVVILWTPLFILNILVCKLKDDNVF